MTGTPEPASPSRRRGAALLALAVAVLALGTGWALAAPEVSYGWRQSMISDLGAVTCTDAGVRWICSPRHAFFNAAQIASGTLLVTAALVLRYHAEAAVRAAALAGGLGLVVLGVFPADVAHARHMVGAVLALPVAAAAVLVGGIRGPAHGRRMRVLLATVVLVLSAAHLLPGDGLRGAAELASALAMSMVFLAEARGLVAHGGRDPRVDHR